MAERKTRNRKRRLSRKLTDSTASRLLDSDTNIINEEQTLWWNHLQENTLLPHSMVYNTNETTRQLNIDSQINSSQNSSQWWRNLEHSDDEHVVSTTSNRNLSAAIIKSRVLETSTSESEKEMNLKKKKIHLRNTSRKSIHNAFSNALDNSITSNLRKNQANRSNVNSELNKETLGDKLQEDKEDSNSSSTSESILKAKPIISQKKKDSMKNQNPFQDVLMKDDTLNSRTMRSGVLEKESLEHSKQSYNMSKNYIDTKKSRMSQAMSPKTTETLNLLPLNIESDMRENNTNTIAQSSNESDSMIENTKLLKLKSRFTQRARKSIEKNVFADALNNDSDSSSSASNLNKKKRETPSVSRSSLSTSKGSVTRSKTQTNIIQKNSPIRRSPRLSSNAAKNRSLDITMQAEDNIDSSSSSSLLDDGKSHKKKSVFLKPKSRIFKKWRKSLSKNPYEKIFEEDNISTEKTNISNNRASIKKNKTLENVSQVHKLSETEESSQLKRNKTTMEQSDDTSLTTSSDSMRDMSEKVNVSLKSKNKSSEQSNINALNSISQKNISKTLEKEVSSNRRSLREKTLKRRTNTNTILTDDTSSDEIVVDNIENDDYRDDTSAEQDLNKSNNVFKSNSNIETRLTHSSLKARSEMSKSANVEVYKVNSLYNDAQDDSSVYKRVLRSSSIQETPRYNLRNRSEVLENTNIEKHSGTNIDNLHNDVTKENNSIFKQISKSSLGEKTRLTRSSLRNRSETPKSVHRDTELSKQSINEVIEEAETEETDNVSASWEIDNVSQIMSSTRFSNVNANNMKMHINTTSTDKKSIDDKNPEPQIMKKKSTLNNKTLTRFSVQSSNKSSVKQNKEITNRQQNLNKSNRSISIKVSGKDISSNLSNKLNSSKTSRKINDFFKIKQVSPINKQTYGINQTSQNFTTEKIERIKIELEKLKNREMAAMKTLAIDKKKTALKTKNMNLIALKQTTKKKPIVNRTKNVNKAFLVNGEVYKVPRLPRPKYWVTDRLYKFLWNRMEPKYKLGTRLKSENFIEELVKIFSLVMRCKTYEKYKVELEALMKEMARLKIINTRNDFYHFCQDFLPHEFRVKVVPMLLPGNKMNIPYDPEKLHIPLISSD